MQKRIFYLCMIAFTGMLIYSGCYKNNGYYNDKNSLQKFDGNTYEFLKSQPNVYDSFLLAVDRVPGLADSLKTGSYTVFAPTNASFQQAIANLNTVRKLQNRTPMNIANLPLDQLDTLIARYIVRGLTVSDSMTFQDGVSLYDIFFGYPMHAKLNLSSAEGLTEGGPRVVTFSDTKGVVYTRQWSNANTVAVDIRTSNGLVNVLDQDHVFGFSELIARVNPTFPTPYLGVPFLIPGTVSLAQYDLGGEGVAYHDNDASNNGNQYRTSEGVDIEKQGEGFDVGWTAPFEWMDYTVYIVEPGVYKGIIRAGSPNDRGTLHFELDDPDLKKRITGVIRIPGTTDWQKYADIEFVTDPLPAGKHVIKLIYDFANYNLRFFKLMPMNRPFPIPGNIMVEDFNSGGEGVGYHDNDASNNGNQYRRSEGVDIELNGGDSQGYDVGWTNDGEWMAYNVEVKASAYYSITARVGSPNDPGDGHKFHFEMNGKDVTGPMVAPKTGGWQNFVDVTKDSVKLERGTYVMKFVEDNGGYNIQSYQFRLMQ